MHDDLAYNRHIDSDNSWDERDLYSMHNTYSDDQDDLPILNKTDSQLRLSGSKNHRKNEQANGYVSGGSAGHRNPFRIIDARINNKVAKSRFHGWRMGILMGSCMSATILCMNIGVLIFTAARGSGFQDGFAEPSPDNPSRLPRLSSIIHIVINMLSTLLLSASNYVIQVLSAPTRAEVDKAHRKGQYFDIGVLSVHNLRRIAWKRLILCAIMILSSVPLHLFYNSAAIFVATSNEFKIFLIQAESPQAESFKNNSGFTYFPAQTWKPAYTSALVKYHDLYLVIDQWASDINITNRTGIPWQNGPSPTTLPLEVDLKSTLLNVTGWTETEPIGRADNVSPATSKYARIVHGYGANSRSVDRLYISLSFLVIVIICNAIKLAVMLWVLYAEKSDFLVTIGDGIASFLEYRDNITEKFCVFSKAAVTAEVSHRIARRDERGSVELSSYGGHTSNTSENTLSDARGSSGKPKHDAFEELVLNSSGVWHNLRYPYSSALGKDREVGSSFIFGVLFTTLVICVVVIIELGKDTVNRSWGTSSNAVLGNTKYDPGNTLFLAWVSNTPQLVLSFCYFAINSECTSIAGALEWNNMASSRKGLRVTKPLQEQRSTYFLQLPLRFSLPLTAISGVLHWLLSQSIFLLRIDIIDREGNVNENQSKSGCGYSGVSFLVLCGVFYAFMIVVGLVGRRHMKMRVPFAASCSLVISAACHAPPSERDPQLKRVQWGVVEERLFDGELHCCISSRPVQRPVAGTVYR